MHTYLLGIDNGGTATKAAVFALDGRQVASASRPVAVQELHPGWSERDAEATWRDTALAIRESIGAAGVAPQAIAAVACTGYGNGLYAVDASGRPSRAAINSSDTRARAIVERWRAGGAEARAMRWTSQQLWAAQPPPLLAWLRECAPADFARIRWVLLCKDFIRFRLTGEICAERTDYSGASLLDVGNGAYSNDLLRCFDLAELAGRLPNLVDSHAICGRVSAHAAAATGLAVGTPVAGGMFDIDACCLASGVLDDRHVVLVAGTWGNCLSVATHPVNDPDIFMTSCFAVPGKYLLLEGSPTSAANLDWALRELEVHSYAEAEAIAATAAIDSEPPFFLPFLYGSHTAAGASACFLGLRASTSRAQLLRAVYEGVAFAQRIHFSRLLRFRGIPESVRLSGGAARSDFWCRLFSDTLGLPLEVPEGEELGAKGAAVAAGIAAGCFQDYEQAVQAMTRIARRYEPDPVQTRSLDRRFQRYRQIVTGLDQIWPLLE